MFNIVNTVVIIILKKLKNRCLKIKFIKSMLMITIFVEKNIFIKSLFRTAAICLYWALVSKQIIFIIKFKYYFNPKPERVNGLIMSCHVSLVLLH